VAFDGQKEDCPLRGKKKNRAIQSAKVVYENGAEGAPEKKRGGASAVLEQRPRIRARAGEHRQASCQARKKGRGSAARAKSDKKKKKKRETSCAARVPRNRRRKRRGEPKDPCAVTEFRRKRR